MRAVEISTPGPADGLRVVERPRPVLAPGEVLVRVAAAGVNRPDVLQRLGKYSPPPGASDIPGLEVAGHVVDVAARADGGGVRWQVGDAVCALVAGGGYAEYCAVPAEQCLPAPAALSLVQAQAAVLPASYINSSAFSRDIRKSAMTFAWTWSRASTASKLPEYHSSDAPSASSSLAIVSFG